MNDAAMQELYYVGAYWGARREDVGECARRVELFFHMLARCDASLGQWYRRGRVARGSPGHPVRTDDREHLEELLLQGRVRTDVGKSVMEELGFNLHAWNQRPDARATTLQMSCGLYAKTVGNVCLMYPPTEGDAAERIVSASVLTQVLTCMATAWDPDWGIATSQEARELMPMKDGGARVGWMTYLARRRGTVPPLPAPVRIEPVGSLGMLVILTPERFTASNPEHIALGRRVYELLDQAGLLKPPPS